MATGKNIEKRNHIVGFREELDKASSDNESFFTWFDSVKDKETAFLRGYWDFSHHIIKPIIPYLRNPEEKVVLEIGYGGGRLLNAASSFFEMIYGVDIHHHETKIADELKERNPKGKFKLLRTNNYQIPLDDSICDVVYSFIVLQHVESMNILDGYLNETYRVLKRGGIVVLYFGRYAKFSRNKRSRLLVYLDELLSFIKLPKGYKEITARVNAINLIVRKSYIIRIMKTKGFKVLKNGVSNRKVPDGADLFGGQFYLVVEKK